MSRFRSGCVLIKGVGLNGVSCGVMVDVFMTSMVVCGSGFYVYTYEVDT